MTGRKGVSASPPRETRATVLAAAERLLSLGSDGFSMRELAAAAGVSFATPFNQFGSKAAIMQALSAERIERMTDRFVRTTSAAPAPDRVLAAVDIAAAVMLESPAVNRTVMGVLGTPGQEPGEVSRHSRALWSMALGDGEGLEPSTAGLARAVLPDQLAMAFRGVLSFWSAGEIGDPALGPRARQGAAALMLGFVGEDAKARLTQVLLAAVPTAWDPVRHDR